ARRLRDAAPGAWRQVARISFASQANTFALMDADDQLLTPLIVWNDRGAAHLPDLPRQLASVHGADAYAQTGIPRLNEQFLPAKLLWLREMAADLWRRTA